MGKQQLSLTSEMSHNYVYAYPKSVPITFKLQMVQMNLEIWSIKEESAEMIKLDKAHIPELKLGSRTFTIAKDQTSDQLANLQKPTIRVSFPKLTFSRYAELQ